MRLEKRKKSEKEEIIERVAKTYGGGDENAVAGNEIITNQGQLAQLESANVGEARREGVKIES